MLLSSTVLIASAGSIILSSILLYLLALKSTGLLISQSLLSASRPLTPLLATPTASLSASLFSSCFSPKPYLTIYDLYMRFAPLTSLTKSTISSAVLLPVLLPRVLPPITLKNLFNRFTPKASAIPQNPPAIVKLQVPPAPPTP